MSIDVSFFKPFIDGTKHTLKVQCQIDIKPGKPFIKGKGDQTSVYDIAGVIGLSCKSFHGSIALCFPREVFLDLMSRMLGETFTEITNDLVDGAAEMMNIIFGQAKTVLNAEGHDLHKAIPTVIRGKNIETRQLTKNPVFVLPFEAQSGVFYIEIVKE